MAAGVYGVLLTEDGVADLGGALKDYLSDGPAGQYLYCKSADPDREFFHLVVAAANAAGEPLETELYLPNRYVKLVMSGLERKHIGFI